LSVANLLRQARTAGVKIATAESCTGGMLAAALTDIAGSSAVFDRGFVTYSNAAKRDMLGVAAATLKAHGAVSEPVAREMAEGALARSASQVAVSITGIAGPGGSEHKPEGRVCFGLAGNGFATRCETVDFGALGRGKLRAAASDKAMALLEWAVLQSPASGAP
jgi:nicotinamide-nucleotide amidase